jgi:hypothetical protein
MSINFSWQYLVGYRISSIMVRHEAIYLKVNSVDPDQMEQMHQLIWIYTKCAWDKSRIPQSKGETIWLCRDDRLLFRVWRFLRISNQYIQLMTYGYCSQLAPNVFLFLSCTQNDFNKLLNWHCNCGLLEFYSFCPPIWFKFCQLYTSLIFDPYKKPVMESKTQIYIIFY